MTTQARLKELFDYDREAGVFTRKIGRPGPNARAGDVAGCDNGQGYIRIYVDGEAYKGHQLAWLYEYGVWPTIEIDHIDGIRSRNMISNLRDVSRQKNMMNSGMYKNNSSGFRGVSFYRKTGKWRAQIQYSGKKMGLGYFETPELAAIAYQSAKQHYFGEFARANG